MYKKNINIFYNLLNKEKHIFISILVILIYIYFRSGVDYLPVENLDIPTGIGVDIIGGNKEYSVPISYYNYGENQRIGSIINTGVSSYLTGSRESRQLITNKSMILGLERVYIFSEAYSQFGIKNLIDTEFKNSNINDTALLAVCNGKAEDILKYQVSEYPSAADYIEGMLKRSIEDNFFSNNYKMMDVFVRMEAEGRNVVLPYIEVKDKRLKITGMALFKEDKMIRKIDIAEARIMNLLREHKVKGILAVQETPKEYISFKVKTKRKVRCEKKEDKFIFYIDLLLCGNIIENELYSDIHENSETMKLFQTKMKEKVEKQCLDFITEMQKEYNVDCLALGRVAAAKYGRHQK
ncbi:Ger(x)C family spore germination protein [Clostridium grantii]|uniref:Germination protein, Ger(X)C family n=1 Tax=Clostridium grantii DSM 8605 TaxID=1121316 RepID=A0A1M5WWP4_9CLOT|nr:Ger(x)C family spore germination protein [Clostridium grantii]SHH92066.1 germination protein, Ger(x)C family [Clostridium grantii DSM 8605]